MPLYEYECENCGTRFERLQSMQAEPVRQCPECAGSVHKVMHAAGIIFKGSGWYIIDSRKSTLGTITGESKASTADTKADKSSDTETKTKPSDDGTKADSKTETKAETKTEAKTETK